MSDWPIVKPKHFHKDGFALSNGQLMCKKCGAVFQNTDGGRHQQLKEGNGACEYKTIERKLITDGMD